MHSMMFPGVTSSYKVSTFDTLIWLGEEGNQNPADMVPAVTIESPGSNIWVIYSHGNGSDIGDDYGTLVTYSKELKLNFIAYEYPGYGVYRGKTTTTNCVRAHKIVYRYLVKKRMIHPKQIIFFGRSIGAGVATTCCYEIERNRDSIRGLILQSAFTSIPDLVKGSFGFLHHLSPNPFDNMKAIQEIKCPILLIHGEKDKLIKANHSKRLFEKSGSKVKQISVCPKSDHVVFKDTSAIVKTIQEFLDKINDTDSQP